MTLKYNNTAFVSDSRVVFFPSVVPVGDRKDNRQPLILTGSLLKQTEEDEGQLAVDFPAKFYQLSTV